MLLTCDQFCECLSHDNRFCANSRPGVWLLARCADLEGLGYSVNAFWGCLGVLLGLGALWRACAAAAMLTLHRDKCR